MFMVSARVTKRYYVTLVNNLTDSVSTDQYGILFSQMPLEY